MPSPPPLTNLRVLEFAGLAPGPYAGLLLADYGASVLRIDRPHPAAHTANPPPPTPDSLTRHKSSITLDIKSPHGLALLQALLPHVDVVIDPFRPGVLEKLGLDPHAVLLAANPRLIVARMTGFRRDGKYKDMAGHDINYIAVSGVLSMLGAAGAGPSPPGNLLGDFAGGGAVCFMGILLALLARSRTGRGQVVAANMVDGSAHLASMPRFAMQTPVWSGPRGTNQLDGGAPYYGVYETKDGRYMSVGALEPQFYTALLHGLALPESSLPPGNRLDRATWPALRAAFAAAFASKTRAEWEAVFDGTDACVAPVLEQAELRAQGWRQRPIVALEATPGRAVGGTEGAERDGGGAEGQGEGVDGAGWVARGLRPGEGGEEVLRAWVGWRRGREFEVQGGGLVLSEKRARL